VNDVVMVIQSIEATELLYARTAIGVFEPEYAREAFSKFSRKFDGWLDST
jgi:hypothetical protein